MVDRRTRTPGLRPHPVQTALQRQRLALACAAVGRPELVFLDEPTAGMDPQARHLVWEMIDALRRDGVAVLLSTHLMDEAEALADDVVVVDHGRVLAHGSPSSLTDAAAPRELRFHTTPGLDLATLRGNLPTGHAVTESPPGRYVVTGPIEPQTLATVTAWCDRYGALAEEIRVTGHSLEDLFLELTGGTPR
jgi:ABC-2 type transport system ATP-binding protein